LKAELIVALPAHSSAPQMHFSTSCAGSWLKRAITQLPIIMPALLFLSAAFTSLRCRYGHIIYELTLFSHAGTGQRFAHFTASSRATAAITAAFRY
jgi:hypothetical protein